MQPTGGKQNAAFEKQSVYAKELTSDPLIHTVTLLNAALAAL
jgi:hypothetical protein